MVFEKTTKSEYVVVDTSAFIRNANLQEIGENIITIPEVVNEIKSKRQLRRLVVLPYDLQIKEAFPENISYVTEFAKKTGDFPSLSATDIKVMAITYQLEKEHVGTEHLKTVPQINRSVDYCNYSAITAENLAGFYKPKKGRKSNSSESTDFSDVDKTNEEKSLLKSVENCSLSEDESDYTSACSDLSDSDEFVEIQDDNAENLKFTVNDDNEVISKNKNLETTDDYDDLINNVFVKVKFDEGSLNEIHFDSSKEEKSANINEGNCNETGCVSEGDYEDDDDDDADDDSGWITPSNVKQMKQEMGAENLEEKRVKVACLTMDFAMQNVLKQMGLNILSLDGRVIKQMRTFILRCYACFKTTSVMTRIFCHHCGNKTLKKVAVSLDSEGKQKIHINLRRPLTARGKKFSLPKPTGGKHSNYPLLSEDQPVPDQRPSRLARMKNNPLEPDYIAGFSPFVMRDVNSRSAMLGVPNQAKEMKYWMRRNPNESFGKKKKKK